MFGLVIIIFQFIALVFIGGFTRSTTSIPNYEYFTKNCLLMLCFVIICAPYKKLSVHAIMVMLIGITIAFEMQLLMGRFWEHVFDGFVTEFQLTASILIQCNQAMLAVLLVCLDFIGIFQYWQMYLILSMILTFGFAMNFGINTYGLDAFDGGGGFNIFLYSGVAALVIWFLVVRGKYKVQLHQKDEYYTGGTLALFAVVGATVYWPLFNSSGGIITQQNTVLTSSATLQNSGYTNTLMALSVGIALAFLLNQRDGTKDYKDKLRTLLDCFINSGIIVASFSDISLNPAASMAAAMLSTIITLIIYRYFYSLNFLKSDRQDFNQAMKILKHYLRIIFRVVIPILGLLFCTIVVRKRNEATPLLLQDQWWRYSRKSGIQIAAFFLSIIFGALFGLASSFALNFFIQKKEEHLESSKKILSRTSATDLDFFEGLGDEEIYPLYLLKQDIYIDEDATARKILRQSILSHVKEDIATTLRNNGNSGSGKIKSNLDKYQTSLILRGMKNTSSIKNQRSEIQKSKSQSNLSPNSVQMPKFYEQHKRKSASPDAKSIYKSKTESKISGLSLTSKIIGSPAKNQHQNISIKQLSQGKSQHKPPLLKTEEKPEIKTVQSDMVPMNKKQVGRKLDYESNESVIQSQNQHQGEDSRSRGFF